LAANDRHDSRVQLIAFLPVQEILKCSNVPMIFVTAFPERLLTGEMLEPAFVVTKALQPYDTEGRDVPGLVLRSACRNWT
jgi:hypothetical protein